MVMVSAGVGVGVGVGVSARGSINTYRQCQCERLQGTA
jgi:hypothetical protein